MGTTTVSSDWRAAPTPSSRQSLVSLRWPLRIGLPAAVDQVIVTDSQPVFAAGLVAILNGQQRYRAFEVPPPEDLVEAVVANAPVAVVVDALLGRLPYATDLVTAVSRRAPSVGVLVSVHTARPLGLTDALRAGARGLVLREAPASDWLTAIAAVVRGQEWIARPLTELLRTQLDPRGMFAEADLSQREKEVLRLVAVGATNAGIAESLGLSEFTVRNHLHSLMGKLRAATRTEAVSIAHELGMLDPPMRR